MTTEPAASGYDLVVIGSGPAGVAGALAAAGAGARVLVVEQDRAVGGSCVQRGTIPSKTLRETAAYLIGLRVRTGGALDLPLAPDQRLRALMARMEQVVEGHARQVATQLAAAEVERVHGKARFAAADRIEILGTRGELRTVRAGHVLVATGSRPRNPDDMPVDHEHVLDSDSVLSMLYLPRSLAILGAGVIASEYAAIFAALGVEVAMVDRYPRPVGFLDPELSEAFAAHFTGQPGCRFLGGRRVQRVAWDGVAHVVTELDDGTVLTTEKVLCALGRVANVEALQLDRAGLSANERGVLPVDEHGRTAVASIYAAGDVIGPPALASASMDQGRRAIHHAFGLPVPHPPEWSPIGIYTIPEMAAVGLTEEEARRRHGEVLVGRAGFAETARGLIAGHDGGLLKLVADRDGLLLGAHAIGEGATELVHTAQMLLATGSRVDLLASTICNFPTLAELYAVAARDLLRRRAALPAAAPSTSAASSS